MTRSQVRANIRQNLADEGITYYSDDEINVSIEDAYSDIVTNSKCLVKNVTINWNDNGASPYFDFLGTHNVSDYLGTTAIFNNQTNMWLRDDLGLRDFDRLRRDWETWRGQSQFWTPHSVQFVAICPINVPGTGSFNLRYWAQAPDITGDDYVFVIAPDMHDLIEQYCTADMLETAEEVQKALMWWAQYTPRMDSYTERCSVLAKSDLLLRI